MGGPTDGIDRYPDAARHAASSNKGPVRITVPEDTKVRYGDAVLAEDPFQSIFYFRRSSPPC